MMAKESLFELIKRTERVSFSILGCGESIYETIEFKNEINELERLIEIGRATEKAYSDFDKFCEERNQAIESLIYDATIGKAITKWFVENGYVEKWGIELHDTDDLLEWAKEE